ncbi:MAG TPA: SgcJ/EcaC family oxidoreductase [Caulobacteraceae bacterium]|nr:SgcJ/EcaC family oxidoreductase [Caulobacteraceae bacterium]
MYDAGLETAAAVDETAVRAAIARAHRAWAAGDGRAYADCFTPQTRDAAFFGLCRDGRAANAELHGALFHGAARGEAIGADVDAIEWLATDVALVRTASNGARPGYQTYLMVRQGGAWRIRSFQHTPVNAVVSGLARWARRGGKTPHPAEG